MFLLPLLVLAVLKPPTLKIPPPVDGHKAKFPQKEFFFFSQTGKAINVSNLNEPYVFNENVMLFWDKISIFLASFKIQKCVF